MIIICMPIIILPPEDWSGPIAFYQGWDNHGEVIYHALTKKVKFIVWSSPN